jgi:hypothetical protein
MRGKTTPEAEDDDCHSSPTKTFTVTEMKKAFDHLKQFVNIIQNVI